MVWHFELPLKNRRHEVFNVDLVEEKCSQEQTVDTRRNFGTRQSSRCLMAAAPLRRWLRAGDVEQASARPAKPPAPPPAGGHHRLQARAPYSTHRAAARLPGHGPDQKWLADLTYVPTNEGWLLVAPVLDLYARKLAGWAMSATIPRKVTRVCSAKHGRTFNDSTCSQSQSRNSWVWRWFMIQPRLFIRTRALASACRSFWPRQGNPSLRAPQGATIQPQPCKGRRRCIESRMDCRGPSALAMTGNDQPAS